MKALVTGGAGFIGSHLVDRLLARGDDVAVLDDLSRGRRENLAQALQAGARLHVGDVRDGDAVAEVVATQLPDAIFHLAAQTDVGCSLLDPLEDLRVNVEGTVRMLEAARAAGVERFVMISTGGAIYGAGVALPTPETATAGPQSPYGTSKLAAEGYCDMYTRTHGLSTVYLRLSNVYGPRQPSDGEGGVVAILGARLLEGSTATVVGDGLQTRDYVYVGDVVGAALAATSTFAGGPINIGTGIETSVLELVDQLRAAGPGHEFRAQHVPARPGEVRRSCLDPGHALKMLGWRPRTALADGLRATLESIAAAAQARD